jgi:hypothetical protein
VYERGKYQTPIYENANAVQGGTTAGAEAFVKERNRARTPTEIELRQETIKRIDGLMAARGASEQERAEVTQLGVTSANEQGKGLRETAGDKKQALSAEEYIRNPEARKEYRAQAEERVKAYTAELRQMACPKNAHQELKAIFKGNSTISLLLTALRRGLSYENCARRQTHRPLSNTRMISATKERKFYPMFVL